MASRVAVWSCALLASLLMSRATARADEPAPTPATQPVLSTKLPAMDMPVPAQLGVNIHFTDPQPGEMKMLADGGFKFVRMDFDWAKTETKPGEYDFSAYERLLAALDSYGIRAIFILDYVNPMYDDARSPDSDAGRAAFAKWAGEAVKHFKGRGVIWEMYNEPNITPFWRPRPNVNDYVKLALEVGKTIREAAPDEIYLGPACSTMDFAFLEACFKAGLLEYWSAVSVHPYRQQNPETVSDDYRKLRILIAKYGPKDKSIPIFSGEWGYSAVSPGMNEQRQGQVLARQWLTNLMNDVPLSIWYDWHDDGPGAKEMEHHFGTVANAYHANRDPVYDPKPAYLAAKALTSQLGGYRFNKRIWLARADDFVLLFEKAAGAASQPAKADGKVPDTGDVRVVAWTSAREPHTTVLPASPGTFSVMSHVGESLAEINSDGAGLSVVLEPAPKYLSPQKPNDLLMALAAWAQMPRVIVVKAPGEARVVTTTAPSDTASDKRYGGSCVYGFAVTTISLPVTRGQEWVNHDVKLEIPGMPPVSQRTTIIVSNPIHATILPREMTGVPVWVENSSGDAFFGTVRLIGHPNVNSTVRLDAGHTETVAWLPGGSLSGELRAGVEILDDSGKLVLRTPVMRYVPLPLPAENLSIRADGDSNVLSTQSLAAAGENEGPSPGAAALALTYTMDPGWKYLCVQPANSTAARIPGTPSSLGLWIRGDASGNIPRMRYTDDTGQTFQSDGPKLANGDWRYVTFPLDGTACRHWGGADDGVVHYPIQLETLFLLDNADRTQTSGKVWISGATLVYQEQSGK